MSAECENANNEAPFVSDVLARAVRIQAAASSVGFDWPNVDGVLDKVREETGEVHDALRAGDPEHAKLELGDLLFAAVNLSRFLHTDPAQELGRACDRFSKLFRKMEAVLQGDGKKVEDCTLHELDAVWDRVKS